MKQNNIIRLENYVEWTGCEQPKPFDYAAYERRAAARHRRQQVLYCIENAVTAAIGFCTVFCVCLVITML